MNIIILGPQGSGKGTQADILSEKFGFTHIESGKILRAKAQTNPKIRQMLNNGLLVPDMETIEYIDEELVKNNKSYDNIIFDGYPRKIKQYELLKKWLEKKGFDIDKVIYLYISDGESINRLSSRRTCDKCGRVYNLITNLPPGENCECGGKLYQREDDTPETIKKRLELFHESTEPILDIAETEGILLRVDGERPIEEISEEIIRLLKL